MRDVYRMTVSEAKALAARHESNPNWDLWRDAMTRIVYRDGGALKDFPACGALCLACDIVEKTGHEIMGVRND